MEKYLLKLNIQLFAEDVPEQTPPATDANAGAGNGDQLQTNMDPTALEELGEQGKIIGEAIKTSLDIIYNEIKNLNANAGFSGEAGTKLQEAMDAIVPEFEKYETSIASLGTFLISVAQVFISSDQEMLGEITAWSETVKSVVQQISGGLNSQVEKGSISPGTYATSMAGSIKNISGEVMNISAATRNIASESATMFANTGDFIKSATGSNILEIGNKAVGTVGTLFGFGSENAGSSIITNLFNTLGTGLGGFLGQK